MLLRNFLKLKNVVKLRNLLLLLVFLCICNVLLYLRQNNFKTKLKRSSNTNEKIDWTDSNFIEREKLRTGLGEHGRPVVLTDEAEKEKNDIMVKEFSYNTIASDKISLDRSIPDTRPDECRTMKYYEDLPSVSVIIVFHNEYLSFLLRTIHSIVNRTPTRLLTEIIVVDDCSTKGNTNEMLDWHIITTYPYKDIRVLRLEQRHGLMKARMAGIRNSTSDIVVVMDAHMEVNTNWLPPLIEPIHENIKTITEPVIDAIEWDILQYSSTGKGTRGTFNWHLTFQMSKRIFSDGEKDSDNFKSPVILGALAAFNKQYFWSIGGYDPGLQIWGGEQYDLSFKVWMCGGRILQIPCSRVGHNFKGSGFHPFISNGSYILPNLNRIAEVWLDEYKEEFYANTGSRNVEYGYLLPQIDLRKRLGCKSFKWYLDTIVPDVLQRFPVDMSECLAYGAIQSVRKKTYCVGALKNKPLGLYFCRSQNKTNIASTEFFLFTKHNEIRLKRDAICWFVNYEKVKDGKIQIDFYKCRHKRGTQYFEYDLKTQQIKTGGNYCLEGDFRKSDLPELYVAQCNETSLDQKWKWSDKL